MMEANNNLSLPFSFLADIDDYLTDTLLDSLYLDFKYVVFPYNQHLDSLIRIRKMNQRYRKRNVKQSLIIERIRRLLLDRDMNSCATSVVRQILQNAPVHFVNACSEQSEKRQWFIEYVQWFIEYAVTL